MKKTVSPITGFNQEESVQELRAKAKKISQRLMSFLEASPTAWQACSNAISELETAGFKRCNIGEDHKLTRGAKGYFCQNDSAIVAFSIGKLDEKQEFHIYGSHSDSPSLRIKPNAISINEGIIRLTTEVYGGPILNTWFDRPLSLAGRVVVRSADPLHPQSHLVDCKRPILILPNVAIHMNRHVNEGVKIENHRVLLPFLACAELESQHENLIEELLASEIGCEPHDILDYDLMLYEAVAPTICGLKEEFISAGRLDNQASLVAGLDALIATATGDHNGINILIITDNEEVGSRSKQGADSFFVRDALETITISLGYDRKQFLATLHRSYMISADLAHAVHPNYADLADPTHRPKLNGGPVIKMAANQAYASDAFSAAVFAELCTKANIPCQYFVNRSDMRGGSTIGPITSAYLPIPTVDVGTPIWGMHSARETGGILDQHYMTELVKYFYSL